MRPLVVTYYTNDAYKALADRMLASAKAVGLPTKGYYIENPEGTWRAGDCRKPAVVLRALKENPYVDVLFVDADCRFLSYPHLIAGDQHDKDIALYFETSNLPASTVMWFRAGTGIRYAERWVEEMKLTPDTPNDMFALNRTTRDLKPRSIFHMIPAYCWTEQWMRPRFGGVKPVIEHFAVGAHDFPVHSWGKSDHTIFKDGDDRG